MEREKLNFRPSILECNHTARIDRNRRRKDQHRPDGGQSQSVSTVARTTSSVVVARSWPVGLARDV